LGPEQLVAHKLLVQMVHLAATPFLAQSLQPAVAEEGHTTFRLVIMVLVVDQAVADLRVIQLPILVDRA
jgi:threonine/homoserine efflux transporter RhtA